MFIPFLKMYQVYTMSQENVQGSGNIEINERHQIMLSGSLYSKTRRADV